MDDQYNNLVTLLKLFINRPYLLGKFLIENNVINKNFLKKISNNKNLEQFLDTYNYIDNVSEMENHYSQYLDEINLSKEDQEIHFNELLKTYLENDEYEKAIEIRDFMYSQKLKIIK